ncbi:unnamed protein product [Symbiodinium natans]|uniref:PPPDE domain-containing protein n=1 Tax=Symbiodinium natans TaxID=878477 RepID=A0A812Q9L2_9DINO|nr:unnamed protein product [Symbiodinium natans]
MGHSHGRVAVRQDVYEDDDDDSATDEEIDVDALAGLNHQQLFLQVSQPRMPHEEEPVLKRPCTSDWDGDQILPKTVLLHVYDLEGFTNANGGMNFLVTKVSLGGAFHAGVEVYSNEWSYGKRGVTCDAPRTVEGHVYRCSIPLGNTPLIPQQVASVLQDLLQVWKGDDYDMFSHNCCLFAADFCRRLGVGEGFPKWIDRFARHLGQAQEVGVALQDGVEQWAKQVMGIVMQDKDEIVRMCRGSQCKTFFLARFEVRVRSYLAEAALLIFIVQRQRILSLE